MIQAEVHGKLAEGASLSGADRWEDVLTSNVFGLLRYLGADVLVSFLSDARNLSGEPVRLPAIVNTAEILFWPALPGWRREPDVVVDLRDHSGSHLQRVIIEAKYRSGKSQQDIVEAGEVDEVRRQTGDQLADELISAVRDYRGERKPAAAPPVLVYLTADFAMPVEDLEESTRRAVTAGVGSAGAAVYWLSWTRLARALRSRSYSDRDAVIRVDLLELLASRGLMPLDAAWRRGFQGTHLRWAFGAARWWRRSRAGLWVRWSARPEPRWFAHQTMGPVVAATWRFDAGRI